MTGSSALACGERGGAGYTELMVTVRQDARAGWSRRYAGWAPMASSCPR